MLTFDEGARTMFLIECSSKLLLWFTYFVIVIFLKLIVDYKESPGPLGKAAECPESTDQSSEVCCKAGNRMCSSLAADEDSVSKVMSCDICCSEPGFCRDCCCILCCKIVDKASASYSYIRCEANIDGYTCGHSCHIDCALRAYMAGTVGGSIGLDAEYYCRRCDSRTDLVSHVQKLLEDSKSIASRDDIEKILKIGICVLRGSERTSAKKLLHHFELAMSKVSEEKSLMIVFLEEVYLSCF